MKIAIGADHAGFAAKEEIKNVIKALGHQFIDVGTASDQSVDYPDYAVKVARAVVSGEADRGVLICGTGIGMSIAANKVPNIRAAVVTDEKTADLSRRHNDANVFCAGARITPVVKIAESLKVWLQTPFEGGRHLNRVNKIAALEKAP
ncbi:MAG TPA: ribose 5-phosphate isomerase B [Planctomycetota bacterium]|nr:ribose 5-phosphate isomerase B [Planctomycetota bacterium]